MAREIVNSHNFTSKDNFNVRGAMKLESAKGQTLTVLGCATGNDVSGETGEIVETGYLKTTAGMFSTISKTAIDGINALIDCFADMEEDSIDITVETRTSNAGRAFIVLTMI